LLRTGDGSRDRPREVAGASARLTPARLLRNQFNMKRLARYFWRQKLTREGRRGFRSVRHQVDWRFLLAVVAVIGGLMAAIFYL